MGASDDRERFDVIVAGIGGHGSAALYHLAKRGKRVLGLEKFTIAHDNGSSHGRRAYELWGDLDEKLGSDVLHITGGLDIAHPVQPYVQTYLNAVETVKLHDLEHEVLSPEEVHSRFPGYSLPAGYQAVYQPQGGIVAPERAIRAHVKGALAHGASLKEQEPLQSWQPDGKGVVVRTAKGVYSADKLVLTAGAWLPEIVPQLQTVTTVERQVIGWFDVDDAARFKGNFPISIITDERAAYYVFPPFDHAGLKIGMFNHLRERTKADDLSKEVTARDEEVLREGVARYFPHANGKMSKAAACMFTNSPDLHFIIDTLPAHEQVVVCSACSGHGYKFCSVIGEVLADISIEGKTQHDISMHRMNPERLGFASFHQSFHRSRM